MMDTTVQNHAAELEEHGNAETSEAPVDCVLQVQSLAKLSKTPQHDWRSE